MKTYVLISLLAIASQTLDAKTLTVGIDLSGSSPIISNPEFSKRAAEAVSKKIGQLALGDWVKVKTFGEMGISNLRQFEIRIDRRNRQKKVADMVSTIINETPKLSVSSQPSTNLVAWLEFQDFSCNEDSEVVIFTDGIESSEYVSGNDFIQGASLPQPESDSLAGCTITMVGIGQTAKGSVPPKGIKHIRSEWVAWMDKAGTNFTPKVEP